MSTEADWVAWMNGGPKPTTPLENDPHNPFSTVNLPGQPTSAGGYLGRSTEVPAHLLRVPRKFSMPSSVPDSLLYGAADPAVMDTAPAPQSTPSPQPGVDVSDQINALFAQMQAQPSATPSPSPMVSATPPVVNQPPAARVQPVVPGSRSTPPPASPNSFPEHLAVGVTGSLQAGVDNVLGLGKKLLNVSTGSGQGAAQKVRDYVYQDQQAAPNPPPSPQPGRPGVQDQPAGQQPKTLTPEEAKLARQTAMAKRDGTVVPPPAATAGKQDGTTDQNLTSIEQALTRAMSGINTAGQAAQDTFRQGAADQGMTEYAPGVAFSWGKGGPPASMQGNLYGENGRNSMGQQSATKFQSPTGFQPPQTPVMTNVDGPVQTPEQWRMAQGMKDSTIPQELGVLSALAQRQTLGAEAYQRTPNPQSGFTPAQEAAIATKAAGVRPPNPIEGLKVGIAQNIIQLLQQPTPESLQKVAQLQALLSSLRDRGADFGDQQIVEAGQKTP